MSETTSSLPGCLACDLASGRADLPGGRIYETDAWLVEHCIGPLGAGTLIVKPKRHCLHVWELTDSEAAELGPLLRRVNETVRSLLQPDQVYTCLWSFMGWTAGHIHFVIQPAWSSARETYEHPGPCMQTEMFHKNESPRRHEVEAFCERARAVIRSRP